MAQRSDGPIAVLATYDSSSTPGKVYRVLLGADEVVYCECPAWRFQKDRSSGQRTCKHIKQWREEGK